MKLHKRQYLFNSPARGVTIVQNVKRVRPKVVIRECNGPIVGQRVGQEAVKRFVKMRRFVPALTSNDDSASEG